jgi:hypothetical protein
MGLYVLIPLLVLPSVTSGYDDEWEDLDFIASSMMLIVLASVVLTVLCVILIRSSSKSRKRFAHGLLVGIPPGVAGGIATIVLISKLAW